MTENVMADRVVSIITPAKDFDIVSLDELKTMFGIPLTDTSQDAQLQMYIDFYSDVIATYCNRVFAYEEVQETWQCVEYDDTNSMKRLFVSHYPIDSAAPITLESPTGSAVDPSSYAIEYKSGKIELLFTAGSEPISVTYAGGYVLPTAAPPALKQAAIIMIREAQMMMQRLGVSGIRSISHKDSRVMYYDINQLLAKGPAGAVGIVNQLANNLLMHYVRLEV
jgi:hypothetical protein